MAEKVNKGWLKDTENIKFAPKTLATNIFIEDGTPFVLEDGKTVARAVKLAIPHNIQIDLSSTEAKAFDGSEDITPGVMNILGITNGGTGNNLGLIQSGKHESAELGERATAEGINNFALGDYSHAEGYENKTLGDSAHAEGYQTKASGRASHTEGESTTANGEQSHAEGLLSQADGIASHAEGLSFANGDYSHAEGLTTIAAGHNSHASGWGTIAAGNHQTVVGAHNIPDYNNYKIKLYFSSSHGYSLEQLQSGNNRWYDNAHNLPWRVLEFIDGTNVLMGQSEGNNIKLENFDINSISSFVSDNNQITLKDFTCEWDNTVINNAGNYAFIVGNSLDSNKTSNAMVVGWDGRTRITNDLIINIPALEDGTIMTDEEIVGKGVLFSSQDATTNDVNKRLGILQTLIYPAGHQPDTEAENSNIDATLSRIRTHMSAYRPSNDNSCYASIYVDMDSAGNAVAGVSSVNEQERAEDGTIINTKINDIVFYGAAWNDYAEFRGQKEKIEPGYCVASSNNGRVYKTTEKFQACDGIVSDTFGFAIGKTEIANTPLAVCGRVLAYCDGNRNDYTAGDTVCAGPGGKVYKMTREEIREWPDRIIGIVSEIPTYEYWNGKVKVNNRIWIKVK